ncbi:MAG TPA: hypothetical protein VLY63_09900 [Anaerolineae bacterium]|nr:hypothetical protein [Anaerolineae bacterium]
MGSLLNTLWRTVILDDAGYQEWRERPNVFLRGIILIIIISLVAGLVTFAVDLVNRVKPANIADIERGMNQWLEVQSQFIPFYGDPEVQEYMEGMMDVMVPMISDLANVQAPLPRGVAGFFNSFGSWLSRALMAIGGWMFYGVLVLIFVNLLGGSAKLPEFLGTVALYIVPGLLVLLKPIPCVGWLLAFVGTIWSIVVYMKATSVAGNLDTGRTILAVVAPLLALVVLGILVGTLIGLWFAIIF